ncbi:MAG TPA: c-type cytochrome [Gallionellaceae bacterium]
MKSIIVSLAATAGLMIAGSAMATEMPPEAKELNCVACHAVDKKVVGPAWADVGKKYKGATEFEYNGKKYPLVEGLVMKVSKGGSGHWGSMPMPANDPTGAKKEKIEKLVKFELSLG